MKSVPIKTHKIKVGHDNLNTILDRYITKIKEKSILVITSKVVSICEKSVIKIDKINKSQLIKMEADYFIPPEQNQYNITLTIKNNFLIPTAGIDESNGNGYYILWPKNPQKSANEVRTYLKQRFKVNHVGVIITDSRTIPLRWGTIGFALAHSGFSALNNYIGQPDIFGRLLHVTKANIADGLAAAAVVAMGEGKEQTPLGLIEDLPFVKFQSRNPGKNEIEELKISLEEDLYAPLIKTSLWKKSTK